MLSKLSINNTSTPFCYVGVIIIFFLNLQLCFANNVNDLESINNKAIQCDIAYIDNSLQDKYLIQETLLTSFPQKNTFHLFSHGKSEKLFINGTWKNAPAIAQWIKEEQLLEGKKHLNIYGCEFAKGRTGRAAVEYLEAALGVFVAASDDITGVDGDWDLEVGGNGDVITSFEYQYNLQSYDIGTHDDQMISTCGGTFYDDGGSANNYATGTGWQNITFCASNGSTITLDFTSFDVEAHATCNFDAMRIRDLAVSPVDYVEYCGTNSPGTVTSTGNCLKISFYSDNADDAPGWAATISCGSTALPLVCCSNENVIISPSFEGDLTPTENFPDATTNPADNSIIVDSNTDHWQEWIVEANTQFDFDVISDAARASDGEEFVYIGYPSGNTQNFCITTNDLGVADPGTACGSGSITGALKGDKRYSVCFDWVPFDKASPNGTSNTTTPVAEYRERYGGGSQTQFTMYGADGTPAPARAGVSWANVSTSWEQACGTITISAGTPGSDYLSLWYSHMNSDNSGMLLDNIIVQEIGITDAGISNTACGSSNDQITFDLNPVTNTGGVPNLNYDVTVPTGFTISPTQGTYGQMTSFTLTTTVDGDFSDGTPTAVDVTLTDAVNASCSVVETVSNPCFVACVNPIADTPTTVEGTCTGSTANNDATITLSNITNGDIAGIVAGADYTSGVAYNANASTNASLETIAANTVTFSNLIHNTQYTVRVFNAANDCFTDFVVTSATISCSVSLCSSLLSNLNTSGTVPDPTLAYVDNNPPFGCGSETMYPSPLVSAEQSGSFSSAFCVPTPLPYRGLDESFQVVIGGDLIIPATGGAEIEGRAAIGGNIQVDRVPYGIAESGGGTYVIGAAGDAVGVGGTVSGAGTLSLGANNTGATYNIVSGGANTAALNNGTKVQNSTSLPLDVSAIMDEVTCLSTDLMNATATGSFDINSFGNGFFVGNNTPNIEIFNVDGSLLNPATSQNSGYADVDLAATLIVNVSGTTVDLNYTVRAGRVDDPTFSAFGGGPLIYNVIWNFYEATDITLHTNFQGTLIAPLANVDVAGNFNGRMYIGGDLTHSGAGTEIHNYPFTGNLSAYCSSCSTCTNPIADTPTTSEGTCAGSTANNDVTITLSNITNGDIAGIVAGADYSSGVAYNADASTNASLEAVAANTVTFSGLTHNTQYTILVFNAANDCFTDFVVTSATIGCSCSNPVLTPLTDESICEGDSFTAANVTTSETAGVTVTYQWSDNNGTDNTGTADISGQTTATLTALPTTAGVYSYRVTATNTADGSCTASVVVNLTVNANPTATAAITDPTCNTTTNTTNDDGTISLSGFSATDAYQYSLGNTFNSGSATPASATTIPVDGIIANNLVNPTGTQTYTIRITNTAACFIDRVVTLNEVDCSSNANIDYPDYSSAIRQCTNEPCHFISNDLYLGQSVSPDANPIPGEMADSDDDDGIFIGEKMQIVPGNMVRFPVTIYNNTSALAHLRIWIDWNADGDFEDAGEQVENNTYPSTGAANLVFVSVTIPLDAIQTSAIALRARLSTDDANSADPCGTGTCAADGEIEDYLIQLTCPTPFCPPVQLVNKTGQP